MVTSDHETEQQKQDRIDAENWRKYKHLFSLVDALFDAASPLVLNKLKVKDAISAAKE